MSDIKRLLIVSHVIHYRHAGRLWAYGPYAREIDIWADLFPEVRIASPCRNAPPPGDAIAFTRPNISPWPITETGGDSVGQKLRQVALLPILVVQLTKAMRWADAVHVRCPGNLGLLGAAMAPTFTRLVVAKYAGQWIDFPGETAISRLQKRILRSRWWHGPVTVYGDWPDQPQQVVPFFTSMMSSQMVDEARSVASSRHEGSTALRILFTGRLSADKNVDVLLDAMHMLSDNGRHHFLLQVVGDGPERASLEQHARDLDLADRVEFVGSVPYDTIGRFYADADVLVLASQSEGWPKSLAEGMAYGMACIGSNRGLVPWMLSEGRGFTVEPGDPRALADTLLRLSNTPDVRLAAGRAASAWACRFTIDRLRTAIAEMLSDKWNVGIKPLRGEAS